MTPARMPNPLNVIVGKTHGVGYPLQTVDRMQPGETVDRVLIADSDAESLGLSADIVEELGFTTITAQDGREAQRILLKETGIAAAVFELVLPHVSGPDLVRLMMRHDNLKVIPAIIMTHSNSAKLGSECFAAGAKALLPKPFKATQLQTLLMTVVSKRPVSAHRVAAATTSFSVRLVN